MHVREQLLDGLGLVLAAHVPRLLVRLDEPAAEDVDQGLDLAELDLQQVHLQDPLVAVVQLVAAEREAHGRAVVGGTRVVVPGGAVAEGAGAGAVVAAAAVAAAAGAAATGAAAAARARRVEEAVVDGDGAGDEGDEREHEDEVVAVPSDAAVEGGGAEGDDGPVVGEGLVDGDGAALAGEGELGELAENALLAAAGFAAPQLEGGGELAHGRRGMVGLFAADR